MKELLASNVEQHDMKLRERDAQVHSSVPLTVGHFCSCSSPERAQ